MAESFTEFSARAKSDGWMVDYQKLIMSYRRQGFSRSDAMKAAYQMFRDSVDEGRAELRRVTAEIESDTGERFGPIMSSTVLKSLGKTKDDEVAGVKPLGSSDELLRPRRSYVKGVVADLGGVDVDEVTMRHLKRLMKAGKLAESNGVKASKNDIANWVFGNIPIAWRDIKADEVPSVGAVGLLFSAKKKGVRERFYVDWLKPKKADESIDVSDGDGLKDDDRSILDIIGELKTANRRSVSVLLDRSEDDS